MRGEIIEFFNHIDNSPEEKGRRMSEAHEYCTSREFEDNLYSLTGRIGLLASSFIVPFKETGEFSGAWGDVSGRFIKQSEEKELRNMIARSIVNSVKNQALLRVAFPEVCQFFSVGFTVSCIIAEKINEHYLNSLQPGIWSGGWYISKDLTVVWNSMSEIATTRGVKCEVKFDNSHAYCISVEKKNGKNKVINPIKHQIAPIIVCCDGSYSKWRQFGNMLSWIIRAWIPGYVTCGDLICRDGYPEMYEDMKFTSSEGANKELTYVVAEWDFYYSKLFERKI